jgi:hypothetical protein
MAAMVGRPKRERAQEQIQGGGDQEDALPGNAHGPVPVLPPLCPSEANSTQIVNKTTTATTIVRILCSEIARLTTVTVEA